MHEWNDFIVDKRRIPIRFYVCLEVDLCSVHCALHHGIFHQLNGRRFGWFFSFLLFKQNYQKSIRIFIHGSSLVWIQTSFPDSQFIELSIFPFLSFTHCLVSVVLTRLYLIFLSSGKIHGICTYIYTWAMFVTKLAR